MGFSSNFKKSIEDGTVLVPVSAKVIQRAQQHRSVRVCDYQLRWVQRHDRRGAGIGADSATAGNPNNVHCTTVSPYFTSQPGAGTVTVTLCLGPCDACY